MRHSSLVHPPGMLTAACIFISAGCASTTSLPEEPQSTDSASYVTTFPEPVKPTPTLPWENGYRTPEEREVLLTTNRNKLASFRDYTDERNDNCVIIRSKNSKPDPTFAEEMAWVFIKETADVAYQGAKNEIKKAVK